MFDLAAGYDDREPVTIRSISEKHDVPARFLVRILLQLKGAGLVQSTRGAAGGYRLSRPPEEISLAEVRQVMEGRDDGPAMDVNSDSPARRVLESVWKQVFALQRQMLEEQTLADLVARARRHAEHMYYI